MTTDRHDASPKTGYEGVFNIDKPEGITSHDVINRIRRLTGVRRVGHAGTLDPLASGVLVVCLGRGTRLLEYLIGQDKGYEATVRLGQSTDTYDSLGTITADHSIAHITREAIQEALSDFRGTIWQRAPAYSAIKKNGRPLYKLARQGIPVDPPRRRVNIIELVLRSWQPPDLRMEILCSSGTYIRSLAHDLGDKLGCGGHIIALRRTSVGEFHESSAVALADLNQDNWRSHALEVDVAVAHLTRLDLSANEAMKIQQGQAVPMMPHHPEASPARAYLPDGRFIGIVTAGEQTWRPHKILLPWQAASN